MERIGKVRNKTEKEKESHEAEHTRYICIAGRHKAVSRGAAGQVVPGLSYSQPHHLFVFSCGYASSSNFTRKPKDCRSIFDYMQRNKELILVLASLNVSYI